MKVPIIARKGAIIRHILITSLENTLVAIKSSNVFETRPFVEMFLSEIHRYFDVILLSGAEESVVQTIVNKLDPDSSWIQSIILLNSLSEMDVLDDLKANGFFGSKTVILKSAKDTMIGKSRKEINVSVWDKRDTSDSTLKDLIPVLKNIVQLRVSDVEGYLKEIRDQMIINVNKGSLTPYAQVLRSETSLEH